MWEGDIKFTEIVNKLRQIFHIGAEHTQMFYSISMCQEQNSDFSITIHQGDYIDSINEIKVDTKFCRGNNQLTQEEITLLRKAYGKINWIVCMTRPEVSYHVCEISTGVKNTTTVDVHTINKVIKYIRNTPSHITVIVLDLSSSGRQLYSDASFDNLPDGGSQGRHVIFFFNQHQNSVSIA